MTEPERRISFARLVDWMERRLSEQEARAVEESLTEADDDTLADVAWLRKFRQATENVPIESPPREVRDALVEVFEAQARHRRPPGFVERLLAGLTFDSNLQPAAGLRALGAQQSRRQLIYHAGMFDLAVNLLARGTDNDLDIDGLVLPREDAEPGIFSVQLLHDGEEYALAAVDEFGNFTILRVPPGRYELVLSADRVEVSVWPLDVDL